MASWPCSQEAFLAHHEVEFDIVGLLVGLLGKMNYQDLQILDLDLAERLPISTWVRLFVALPSLVTLELSWGERELFGALIDGIGDAPTHSENTSAAPTAFPFQALKLGRRSQLYQEEDMDFMLKCLRKRLDLGMGLKETLFQAPRTEDVKLQVDAFKETWWRLNSNLMIKILAPPTPRHCVTLALILFYINVIFLYNCPSYYSFAQGWHLMYSLNMRSIDQPRELTGMYAKSY